VTERGETAEAPFSELAPLAPRRAEPAAYATQWSARLWEQLLHALPALLMAVLAALSWWLVKNTPVPGDPAALVEPLHEPDYTMRGFSLSSYAPGGALRSRLEGDQLHHYPDTDTIEVETVRLRLLDEQGRETLGHAKRALSNGDATQVRLMGDARIVREPAAHGTPDERIEIRSEFLEVFSPTERVRSHLPVTVVTGRGEMRAGSLEYSHLDRIAQLGGRVTGVLRPAPARP
jgi:lipopolysaccharide export system protein LptC